MKRSEELRIELEELKALKEKKYHEMVTCRVGSEMKDWESAWNEYYAKCGRQLSEDIRGIEHAIIVEINRELDVGDGATLCLYSDRYACTVISKTAKTITVQRDKATLDPNFKPEFISGGFAVHCINQEDQRWTYDRDPNGEITRCFWSEKLGRYTTGGDQSVRISPGRHEFYDYNF